MFDPLSAHQLLGVARLMAEELNDRLKPKNITLKMTDNALQYAVSQVGLFVSSFLPGPVCIGIGRVFRHSCCCRGACCTPC